MQAGHLVGAQGIPHVFARTWQFKILFTTSLRRSFLMTASNGVSAAATFPFHGATGARKL